MAIVSTDPSMKFRMPNSNVNITSVFEVDGPSGSVTGRIIKDSDGSPVANAIVELRAGNIIIARTTTDNTGMFHISGIPYGPWTFYIIFNSATTTHSWIISEEHVDLPSFAIPSG